MAEDLTTQKPVGARRGKSENRLSVDEVAKHLGLGQQAVYAMLEQGKMPGIRVGRRWIITRLAYEKWEQSCGMSSAGKSAAKGSDA